MWKALVTDLAGVVYPSLLAHAQDLAFNDYGNFFGTVTDVTLLVRAHAGIHGDRDRHDGRRLP